MKTLKIFDNDKEVYSGNCSVNTAILRGRIYSDLREVRKGTAKFSLQLSNGKDKVTGEWNKSTYADCTAFGETAQRILKEYIEGPTIYELVLQDKMQPDYIEQVQKMCAVLYPAHTNIDYFPTNFVVRGGEVYYIDFECNPYMEEWNFENWGMKYWSKTPQFMDIKMEV